MNLLVRFGRSPVDVVRGILPLVGAFHLKFWDLDDADGRVSQPLRDLGALLRAPRPASPARCAASGEGTSGSTRTPRT